MHTGAFTLRRLYGMGCSCGWELDGHTWPYLAICGHTQPYSAIFSHTQSYSLYQATLSHAQTYLAIPSHMPSYTLAILSHTIHMPYAIHCHTQPSIPSYSQPSPATFTTPATSPSHLQHLQTKLPAFQMQHCTNNKTGKSKQTRPARGNPSGF